MGEYTISVIDVEEALPPSLLADLEAKSKDKRPTSVSKPVDIEAKSKDKRPTSVSDPVPESFVQEPCVWTAVSEPKPQSPVSEPSPENTPTPEASPPTQPKRRHFSDLFAKLNPRNTLSRAKQPTSTDPEETTLASDTPVPVAEGATLEIMADDHTTPALMHPEPAPVPALDGETIILASRDTEQDSGTYEAADDVSVSSDNTDNSDLYTDTEDPAADPDSVVPVSVDDVATSGPVNSAAALGNGETSAEGTSATADEDGKDKKGSKKEKKKKKEKTPGCAGNLFSCMKKPGSKKKKQHPTGDAAPDDAPAEAPVEEVTVATTEDKVEAEKEEQRIDEGINMAEGDAGNVQA